MGNTWPDPLDNGLENAPANTRQNASAHASVNAWPDPWANARPLWSLPALRLGEAGRKPEDGGEGEEEVAERQTSKSVMSTPMEIPLRLCLRQKTATALRASQ